MVPPFVKRPNQPQVSFDMSSSYNFIVFDIETTTTGKLAEICQLSAVTASKDGKEFNSYVLPERAISPKAPQVNKLSVRSTANGEQVLLKDGAPVDSITIAQCLAKFIEFITPANKETKTVLIGHNSTVFDTPTLLRSGGQEFADKLSQLNVMFADSLHLTRTLIKAKHPSLIQANNKPCNTNMSSLYQCLFEQQFPAHDALEDVKALRRILFSSPLDLQDADVFEKGNTRSAIFFSTT